MIYSRQQHALISRQICTLPHGRERSLSISWRQRITKEGALVGTGYFIQTHYKHNKEGLRQRALNRLMAAMWKSAERAV